MIENETTRWSDGSTFFFLFKSHESEVYDDDADEDVAPETKLLLNASAQLATTTPNNTNTIHNQNSTNCPSCCNSFSVVVVVHFNVVGG